MIDIYSKENSNGQINLLLALVRQSDNAPYDRYLFQIVSI